LRSGSGSGGGVLVLGLASEDTREGLVDAGGGDIVKVGVGT